MANIIINGLVSFDETSFIGLEKHQNMIEKFENVINNNYEKLKEIVKNKTLSLKQDSFARSTFCFYYSVNSQEPYMAYFINAIEADPKQLTTNEILENNLCIGTVPFQKNILKITHKGAYKTLGEAWQKGDEYIKENSWLRNVGSAPFERYIQAANNSSDEMAVTEIYIPVII